MSVFVATQIGAPVPSRRTTGCAAVTLLAALSVLGCHGSKSDATVKTTPHPASPQSASTVASDLTGTWVGALPPSSDGTVTQTQGHGQSELYALLQFSHSDATGSDGDLTVCSMQQTVKAGHFEKARLGTKVPLDERGNTISFVSLSQSGAPLTIVLRSNSQIFAGNLQHGSETDFHSRCKL